MEPTPQPPKLDRFAVVYVDGRKIENVLRYSIADGWADYAIGDNLDVHKRAKGVVSLTRPESPAPAQSPLVQPGAINKPPLASTV